jgi:hypothetical protein
MRQLLLLASLALPGARIAQTAPPTTTDLQHALIGSWTGVLEYRDYSEPATSAKRVQLPAWLTIAPIGDAFALHFIYDDGPTKTVTEDDTWRFDSVARTFSEASNGKPALLYSVDGLATLKAGRGDLILTGKSTDNNKSAESRIILTLRRNLIAWTEEVRPEGSAEPFAFRHRYVFTRATPPKL